MPTYTVHQPPAKNGRDADPQRFVFVRDVFLKLPPTHPWYKRLMPDQEQLARAHLAA